MKHKKPSKKGGIAVALKWRHPLAGLEPAKKRPKRPATPKKSPAVRGPKKGGKKGPNKAKVDTAKRDRLAKKRAEERKHQAQLKRRRELAKERRDLAKAEAEKARRKAEAAKERRKVKDAERRKRQKEERTKAREKKLREEENRKRAHEKRALPGDALTYEQIHESAELRGLVDFKMSDEGHWTGRAPTGIWFCAYFIVDNDSGLVTINWTRCDTLEGFTPEEFVDKYLGGPKTGFTVMF